MPTDTLLVSLGVCIAFLVFAFAVAWADHSTTQWLRRRAAEEQTQCKAEEVGQKAARGLETIWLGKPSAMPGTIERQKSRTTK